MGKNVNRILGGSRAKASGSSFEKRLQEYVDYQMSGACALRIHDGARRINSNTLVPVAQSCDFVLMVSGKAIFLDTKSTANSAYHSPLKDFQFKELSRVNYCGGIAGYLVEFQKALEITWFPISKLKQLVEGKSTIYLPRSEGIIVGQSFPMQLDLNKIIDAKG